MSFATSSRLTRRKPFLRGIRIPGGAAYYNAPSIPGACMACWRTLVQTIRKPAFLERREVIADHCSSRDTSGPALSPSTRRTKTLAETGCKSS
jgi:hypothetical protein